MEPKLEYMGGYVMTEFIIRKINGTLMLNRSAYDEYQREADSRVVQGRYSLEEAALAIADATGGCAGEMLEKLKNAAFQKKLPVYVPGQACRYLYGEGYASHVRAGYEEVYWDDLNEWLALEEKRIDPRFLKPESKAAKTISESALLENWMMRVQAEAAIRWRRYRTQESNPTRHMLAGELAAWCKSANILTTSHINPTAEYLYRHVLSKKRWTPPDDR